MQSEIIQLYVWENNEAKLGNKYTSLLYLNILFHIKYHKQNKNNSDVCQLWMVDIWEFISNSASIFYFILLRLL